MTHAPQVPSRRRGRRRRGARHPRCRVRASVGLRVVGAGHGDPASLQRDRATPPYTAAAYLATCATQTRYVFTNHGNTFLLRESNGKTDRRRDQLRAPARRRYRQPRRRLRRLRGTAAGSDHRRAAARDLRRAGADDAGRDPQLAGHRSRSTPTSRSRPRPPASTTTPPRGSASCKTATGVDLVAVADTDAAREAACEALPGATRELVPARRRDAVDDTAAWARGPGRRRRSSRSRRRSHAAEPIDALTAAAEHDDGARAASRARCGRQHEIASLKAALTPPQAARSRRRRRRSTRLAADGLALKLAGPAEPTVNVRLLVRRRRAQEARAAVADPRAQSVALGADGDRDASR